MMFRRCSCRLLPHCRELFFDLVLHILQSSETSYLIKAGCTVTHLVHGQELVDSLKLVLVHEERPFAVLVGIPVSRAAISTDRHGRNGTSGGT